MPAGRPTKYKPDDHPRIAEALAKRGATVEEIAEALGCCIATITLWQSKHEEFSAAIKSGREYFDSGMVENALLQRALGYTAPDCKVFMVDRATVVDGEVITEKVEHIVDIQKHYPPETAAIAFWLKNRQPDRWRDRIDHEHTGANRGPIRTITETMTPQEAAEAYADTLHDE